MTTIEVREFVEPLEPDAHYGSKFSATVVTPVEPGALPFLPSPSYLEALGATREEAIARLKAQTRYLRDLEEQAERREALYESATVEFFEVDLEE